LRKCPLVAEIVFTIIFTVFLKHNTPYSHMNVC
jgi:hypothetical protein